MRNDTNIIRYEWSITELNKKKKNSEVLANITENKTNTIRNIKNISENIENRIGKQYNKFANLHLAVITPHK